MRTKARGIVYEVARQEDTEKKIRARFRAWLIYYRRKKETEYPLDGDFAAHLGIKPPTLSSYLSGKRTIGLDTALKMKHVFGRPLDDLAETMPPPLQDQDAAPPSPLDASRPTASPRKHVKGGGSR